MKTLNCFDEFFLYDDEKSLSNTGVVTSCEKFEFQMMSEYIKKELFYKFPHAIRL
jgi:hypothetical protein